MEIDVVCLTGEQIGDLKKIQFKDSHAYKFIPNYCLNDKDQIISSEMYLQYVNYGDEIYYLFDYPHTENPLNEEICNIGFLDIDIDWSILKTLPNIKKYGEIYCNPSDYLLFNVEYICDYDGDCNVEIDLIGYLNKEKQIVLLEQK